MKSKLDVALARQQTHGCEQVIHFNNAGSSLTPAPVADVLYNYLRQEEMKGGYETAAAEAEAEAEEGGRGGAAGEAEDVHGDLLGRS